MNFVQPIRNREKIEEIKSVLQENGTRDLLLFVMGINTGLRISDLLKLTVLDVKDKSHIEIKEQKTGKIKRFPIQQSLQQMLNDYIKNKSVNEYLFKSRNHNNGSKPITRVMAYEILNNACAKCDIKDKIGTHTLRKTFGYHYYQKTHDIALLQKILNHSSPSITLRYIGIEQDNIDASIMEFEL